MTFFGTKNPFQFSLRVDSAKDPSHSPASPTSHTVWLEEVQIPFEEKFDSWA
jgi:hypothetical protein